MTITDTCGPANHESAPRTPWAPRSSVARPGDLRPVLRVDLLLSGETHWASNDVRFLDEGEALAFAQGLCGRWNLVDAFRTVPAESPRGQVYEPGGGHLREVSGGAATPPESPERVG